MSDRLASYNAKRDFAKTAEPQGEVGKSGKAPIFIVQQHAARRLHWDFRLEHEGVLLSWAVTRGPSTDPKARRLAVRTEDHPVAYAEFEGTIPAKQYGGGTVMLWDRGSWEPVDDPARGIAAGKLHFRLHGERMQGEWVLIRLPKKERAENWLLFKLDDAFAGGPDLISAHTTSVATGRTMQAIAKGAPPKSPVTPAQAGAHRPNAVASRPAAAKRSRTHAGNENGSSAAPPTFIPPQLATLTDTPPAGNAWLNETKYDGYRVQLAVGPGRCIAYSRAGLDWTGKFAAIAAAAAKLPCTAALIDGEVCALDASGKPGFAALQQALSEGGSLVAFLFDLMHLDGEDLTGLPLKDRKARLETLLKGTPRPLVYADHVRGQGERLFQTMCAAGQEGIIAKRADARYRTGRSGDWLKVKCGQRQEFVIAGWSESQKGRGFASLLLALREGDTLRYAGRVGTGFDQKLLASLSERLRALETDTSPFAGKLPAAIRRGAHWVRPELVAEIAFAEFTADGLARHASFLGLREDKPATDVVAEIPATHAPGISSGDRVLFPDIGLTKQGLADYYQALAEAMLPDLSRRLVSLVRCPQGRGKACFFQKHDSGALGDAVHHQPVTEAEGDTENYLWLDSAEGILACVQMNSIEFHIWGSRVPDYERPDRLVFDLDPDEGIPFDVVKSAAVLVRDRLAARGLPSLPMVTGGKGVHVVALLKPGAEWPAVKQWARDFADALAAETPRAFTTNMRKSDRKGRIFIDWLRNQRGATAVAPFSVRNRPGAPVAVPISWDELAGLDAANGFSAARPAEVIAAAARRPKPTRPVPLP